VDDESLLFTPAGFERYLQATAPCSVTATGRSPFDPT
jgi:hypothetical protein